MFYPQQLAKLSLNFVTYLEILKKTLELKISFWIYSLIVPFLSDSKNFEVSHFHVNKVFVFFLSFFFVKLKQKNLARNQYQNNFH